MASSADRRAHLSQAERTMLLRTDARMLAAFAAFVNDHGRMPSYANAAEEELTDWVRLIRNGGSGAAPEVVAFVKEITDRAHTRERRLTSDHGLAELEAFIDCVGRWPSSRAAGERAIANWALRVRTGQSNVTAETAARVAALLQVTPRQDQKTVGATDHRLEELRDFVARTNRMPKTGGIVAQLNGGAEKSLALWVATVRRGKALVSPEVAEEVGWIVSRMAARRTDATPS